jgi:hypothetical protein
MDKVETYLEVVKSCRRHMMSGDEPKHSAFDFSTFLSIAFNIPKEMTLEALRKAGEVN